MVNYASVTIPDRNWVRRLAGAMRRHPDELAVRRKTDPTPTTLNWRSHMTLIKSILLGSAAGLVAVASAQAADLPTRKAAPVEYVRVCNVGGVTGWTLPGSDTCLKLWGYITGHFVGGNPHTSTTPLHRTRRWFRSRRRGSPNPGHLSQVLMVQGGNVAAPVFNGITGKPLGFSCPASKIRPTIAVKRAGRPAPTWR